MDRDKSEMDRGRPAETTGGEAEGVDLDAKLSATPPSLSRTKVKTREEVENVHLSSKVYRRNSRA